VCTIGYISTNYCKRDLDEVVQDISRYAGWAADYNKSGLAVHGIFFDETPNHYSAEVGEYLDGIRKIVKDSSGILGERLVSKHDTETQRETSPLVHMLTFNPFPKVIHNPGTVTDAEFANPGPDITMVVEEKFRQYQSAYVQERLAVMPQERSGCGYIVHSVPDDEVQLLVQQLRHRGQYLFVTSLTEDYYAQFGPSWNEFVVAMQLT
jgi:hypothetical protein